MAVRSPALTFGLQGSCERQMGMDGFDGNRRHVLEDDLSLAQQDGLDATAAEVAADCSKRFGFWRSVSHVSDIRNSAAVKGKSQAPSSQCRPWG